MSDEWPICPLCERVAAYVSGKHGKFWGCGCGYIEPIGESHPGLDETNNEARIT